MAIKLADTLAPMADFPAAMAEHIQFSDNESLQTKFDNGSLGSGSGGSGEENAIDSISVNGTPLTPDENKNVDITVPSIEGLATDYLKKTEATETYVAKESGKSLIADTEIERLAGVNNYDDAGLDNRVKTIEGDYAKSSDIPSLDGYATTEYVDNKETPISAKEDNAIIKRDDGLYVSPAKASLLEYINTTQGIEDSPVGHIIAHMGNSAPTHYLICDGTEYNIADYPYLAQHFIDEFGSVNYFGGDGTTTFAVPDLRGEFLRGTGTAIRNSGSGANVGVHQEGTKIPNISFNLSSSGYIQAQALNNNTNNPYYHDVLNVDTADITRTYMNTSETVRMKPYDHSEDIYGGYTTRPTNTSVLYCIKYEPTYFMNVTQSYAGFNTIELFNGNATEVQLDESISQYSYLDVEVFIGDKDSNGVALSTFAVVKVPIGTNIISSNIYDKDFGFCLTRVDCPTFLFTGTLRLDSSYLLSLKAIGYISDNTYNDRLGQGGYKILKVTAYKSVEVNG